MQQHPTDGIVADGYDRALSASLEKVRAEVEREHAEELAQASLFRRWVLRFRIAREVRRRAAKLAPWDALHGQAAQQELEPGEERRS